MGIERQRWAVRAMLKRWSSDLERLEALFGGYGPNHFSPGAEMQRNLGTAIENAREFMAREGRLATPQEPKP